MGKVHKTQFYSIIHIGRPPKKRRGTHLSTSSSKDLEMDNAKQPCLAQPPTPTPSTSTTYTTSESRSATPVSPSAASHCSSVVLEEERESRGEEHKSQETKLQQQADETGDVELADVSYFSGSMLW